MKQLQEENSRLKQLVAELSLDKTMLAGCAAKKVLKPSRRRPLVDHLRDQYRASERHACRVLLMVRGTYRYKSHQEPWTELRLRIREIAQSRVRYGYRKIRVLLNREGWDVGKHLVYRLYKEEGLALKKRPQTQEEGGTASRRALPRYSDRTRHGASTSSPISCRMARASGR